MEMSIRFVQKSNCSNLSRPKLGTNASFAQYRNQSETQNACLLSRNAGENHGSKIFLFSVALLSCRVIQAIPVTQMNQNFSSALTHRNSLQWSPLISDTHNSYS